MMLVRLVLAIPALIFIRPSHCLATSEPSLPVETLLSRAQSFVDDENPMAAFDTLSQIYAQNPDAPGLPLLFEACLRLKVDKEGNVKDRFGLTTLLLGQERYEEASVNLCNILFKTDKDNVSDQVTKLMPHVVNGIRLLRIQKSWFRLRRSPRSDVFGN